LCPELVDFSCDFGAYLKDLLGASNIQVYCIGAFPRGGTGKYVAWLNRKLSGVLAKDLVENLVHPLFADAVVKAHLESITIKLSMVRCLIEVIGYLPIQNL
jgi:hypothetical protein